ncbi:hypothetical protein METBISCDRAFT_30662 [Metschnikowia bicuspidata]|uniref:GATA-type domain-containing protein n=1 Tax=Metschnikowia bicuspidata TaxID=27322 RepID=A0A4P9ZFK7_9ASCO|nr:hypothetical protein METBISCDRAFT_30662 [Metschnikowia bicuspidata]
MSEIQRLPAINNPIHPNTKPTTQITNVTITTKSNMSSPVCRNCKTLTTPLWRRDETGQVLCNACGLFLKLHGRARPISLKTDTIKLRNRIKQPNFNKNLRPNTPEIKLQEPKSAAKDSPINPKKRTATSSPMDAVSSNSAPSAACGAFKAMPSPTPSLLLHLGRMPGSFHQQVQLLNYPSSTPTHFAQGLQRIMSPLLLSTTLSVLNAWLKQCPGAATPISTAVTSSAGASELSLGALTDAQAAGALENMSNELGPSVSFKSGASGAALSLIAPTGRKPLVEPSSLSTRPSALNQAGRASKFALLGNTHESASHSVIVSPSFGPQFHFSEAKVRADPMDPAKPSLPQFSSLASISPTTSLLHLSGLLSAPVAPGLDNTYSGAEKLAPIHSNPVAETLSGAARGSTRGATRLSSGSNLAPGNNPAGRQPGEQSSSAGSGSVSGFGASGQSNGDDNSNSNNNASASAYEISLLKTRISELELVNDLYRTRIMELEAMEQAARLREQSMRRRLDEFLVDQGQDPVIQRLSH